MPNRMRWMARPFAAVTLTLAAATSAHAQIDSTRCVAPFRFFFGGSAPFPAYVFVKAGKTCTSGFSAGSRMTFKRLYLAAPPSKGKVTLREGGFFTYHAPSQPGRDSFTLKVCGKDNNLEGCADLQVQVEVSAS
jgi:hypothetical protein